MTDHISPDRFKLAVGIAYSAFCEREHRRGGHRRDDMAAAITAALPDLLADLTAENERLRADIKEMSDPNGQMAQHYRHEGASEARGLCGASGLPQRDCKVSVCDCFVPSIDELIRYLATERARADAATGQLAAVAALLAKCEAWTGDRDYEWKSSPLDRERLRAVLDDPDGALRAVKADVWDSGRSFGYQDAQAYHGNGVIGAGCGPDSWDCDCTNPYRAASHDGSPT